MTIEQKIYASAKQDKSITVRTPDGKIEIPNRHSDRRTLEGKFDCCHYCCQRHTSGDWQSL